jgi:hypothetical protein
MPLYCLSLDLRLLNTCLVSLSKFFIFPNNIMFIYRNGMLYVEASWHSSYTRHSFVLLVLIVSPRCKENITDTTHFISLFSCDDINNRPIPVPPFYPQYLIFVNMFTSWIWLTYFVLDVKQRSTHQQNELCRLCFPYNEEKRSIPTVPRRVPLGSRNLLTLL